MKPRPKEGLVLGFQPNSQGFGWVAFSSPLSLYDWGLCHVKTRKNAGCLKRLDRLLSRIQPEAIVLEAYDTGGAKRSARVVALCKAVVALAIENRIDVAVYTRGQVKACFGGVGARTRQEIAEAVARSFVELRPRLPRPRAAWDAPDRRMAMFDAVAAVLTHYQLGISRHLADLFEDSG